ncbi:uncharacterized protein DUF1761 [Aliiruegeria haliotis]|uniref:Uncharacterized protein DUF1761 n=1 Tax=Aliiruegeria haliotis TaxID=1280846 RepID=A0A2T0RHU7_9RHOB|nr:DUF1761 domain-containing protein [Aliiruegeria haliotis]PRY20745.1 uncharacterized protein DUF1761 [Aliiruegeria haliotis]
MGLLSVLVAGAAAWVFGALWYSVLSQRWLEAAELGEGDIDPANPIPYIISFLCAVLVAGMTRHILVGSGVETLGGGFVSGLGLGLFIATPWIVTNYLYSQRKPALIVIDGGYATLGCAIIGAVLMFF